MAGKPRAKTKTLKCVKQGCDAELVVDAKVDGTLEHDEDGVSHFVHLNS